MTNTYDKYLVIQVHQQRPDRWRADLQLSTECSIVEVWLVLHMLREFTDI